MHLSCNGTEAVHAESLKKYGADTKDKVHNLAHKIDTIGAISLAESNIIASLCDRQPPWTAHEMTRLTHIIADPHLFVAFQKLYKKPSSSAQIEENPYNP